ncbi:MAG: zinc dependent phospholipase C family protein [Ferruginibacter sp.]|nr:S1/P1 Nuclease [Ferruginibacter sp.]
MKKILMPLLLVISLLFVYTSSFCWGFYAHPKINHLACYLLPPEMLVLFKPNIGFLEDHAVDPDKRRYAIKEEGPRHFIDIDYYGKYPFTNLPHKWSDAVAKFSEDTLQSQGIVPWHIQVMLGRLTKAFREKNYSSIMKNSAEIGHYIADSHVPLHANSNHNGQYTNQKGIHGFWESRVPELIADKQWDFMIGKAFYIKDPGKYIWDRVLESANASDSVLRFERELTKEFSADKKFSFEDRKGKTIKQYSTSFSLAFDKKLNGMIERRMRLSIQSIASFWYTAWVNAGQPNLKSLVTQKFNEEDTKEFEELNNKWNAGGKMIGRQEEE